ncbi:putative amidohydrolase YtcJ [Saccharothrix coeruleofusca]|uniref:amidohydrolase n=1 Tax=Saccharothrix coeruleofusca TaxID=33919 RepID=UPI001AE6CC60|nr:amidohydrolase [Saccharothrix coeruleofusca]MBP2334102.1 putative amidohydrolase YtcJ [Saccharothrix coeruleofusca]
MILDLKLTGGRVLTMAPDRPAASTVGVWRGLVVGLDEEVADLPARREADLDGAVVLPGFVDAHNHLAWAGRAARTLDISGCATVADIVDLLAADRGTGWLEVAGYDHRALDRPLTAKDLDRIGRPVYVQDLSGHACVVDSATLAALPAEALHDVQRDERGEPTGFLAEAAQTAVRALRLPYSLDDVVADIEAGARQCLRQGVVLAAEAGVAGGLIGSTPLEVGAYQRADLPIRVQLMVAADQLRPVAAHRDDRLDRAVALGLRTGLGDAKLSIGALKVFTDGGMIARTAALTEPYEGIGGRGQLQDDPEVMRASIVDGHAAGWQLAVHAIGDRAIDFALDALAEAVSRRPRPDARHRIEHCGLVRPDQLDRIAELNLIPVVQPTFLWAYGDDYSGIMGPRRAPWMYRGKSFLDRGIPIAGSSDRPVADGSPLRAIQFMVERLSSTGLPVGPDERLTVEQALSAYTAGSAYACRREHDLGSVAPGKRADFAVLEADPRTTEPSRIADIAVLATVVAGEFAHNPAGFPG